eukprot:CAMPEP_0115562304 /NCGR_PEP_ID=MMETSP0271-20121206/101436_1 /TAXON_ID=71861 /ORGANISM="Scrippsiella trochoidea, Strain CCMP3099" /LENGTH=52 /DNA_ID=CAMNT_0002996449 /DNA_START=57 /DNA_END=215 /DNA_ORIENTATION=+
MTPTAALETGKYIVVHATKPHVAMHVVRPSFSRRSFQLSASFPALNLLDAML